MRTVCGSERYYMLLFLIFSYFLSIEWFRIWYHEKYCICPPRQIGIRYLSSSSLSVFASSGRDLKKHWTYRINKHTHFPASLFLWSSLMEPKLYVWALLTLNCAVLLNYNIKPSKVSKGCRKHTFRAHFHAVSLVDKVVFVASTATVTKHLASLSPGVVNISPHRAITIAPVNWTQAEFWGIELWNAITIGPQYQ